MSYSTRQIWVESEKEREFDRICKELGVDDRSIFNMFINTVIREQGIPFLITLKEKQHVVLSTENEEGLEGQEIEEVEEIE